MRITAKDIEGQLTRRTITGEPVKGQYISAKNAAADILTVIRQVEMMKKENATFIYANGVLTCHVGTFTARIDIAAGSDAALHKEADYIQRVSRDLSYKDAYLSVLSAQGRRPYDAILLHFLRDII